MARFRYIADQLLEEVALATGSIGRPIRANFDCIFDRSSHVSLQSPGRVSSNGSCRLLQAADGWVALNLPRPEDWDMVPALTLGQSTKLDWNGVEQWIRTQRVADVLERGCLLGLAISRPDEAQEKAPGDTLIRMASGSARKSAQLKVVDLSRIWAGPLCGRIFADMGADVMKVETGTGLASMDEFDISLNGSKRRRLCDFNFTFETELAELIMEADVLITSGRPRSFEQAGLVPSDFFRKRPGSVWIAVTAHGWHGPGAGRIGFGDDAAVAGGLVVRSADGAPEFLGDALADPLTGLAAALAGLDALRRGGGYIADVSMSGTAAWIAARMASQDNVV